MLRLAAVTLTLALLTPCARATGPADYIYLPAVTYGEHEIDFKAGSWHRKGEERLDAWSIGYGYGVTQNWFTEVYRKYQGDASESFAKFDAWEWENKFQLTEPGQYPVDAGFIVEIERPQNRAEGYEFRMGPLLQTETGRVQWNGNLLFQRNVRTATPQRTQLGYQFQAKYRWKPELEFGMQAFGEVGTWNHWDPAQDRTHRLGPAVFGKLPLGDGKAIRYNAAWLVGATSEGAPRNTVRMQVEYEF